VVPELVEIRAQGADAARAALEMVIVARETASTSSPTRNGSRMLFPRNCAANAGGSIEKLPYGS